MAFKRLTAALVQAAEASVWVKGVCVGRWGIVYVNPADNPREQ
jgi:hypothetical protein